MLSVKRISDFTLKTNNIDRLKVQLLRDGLPNPIPEGSTVTLLVSDGTLIINEPMEIVDYENAIVQITLKTDFGEGEFKCEYVLTNENDDMLHLTFPDNGFDSLKVIPSLKDKLK